LASRNEGEEVAVKAEAEGDGSKAPQVKRYRYARAVYMPDKDI
jgi:hypothetical protein